MAEAEYFSTGSYEESQFYHYGLASHYYTHFTSPIRRYADVIVHRQLISSLEEKKIEIGSKLSESISKNINVKHRTAKAAAATSQDFFACKYFENRSEEKEEAVISSVLSNGLIVFVPKYGIKGVVFIKDQEGNLKLPPNVFSLSPQSYQSQIFASSASFDPLSSSLVFSTNQGNVKIGLFDKITVSFQVFHSRYHLPSLRFNLLHFGSFKDSKFPLQNETSSSPSQSDTPQNVNITSTMIKSKQKNIEDIEVIQFVYPFFFFLSFFFFFFFFFFLFIYFFFIF